MSLTHQLWNTILPLQTERKHLLNNTHTAIEQQQMSQNDPPSHRDTESNWNRQNQTRINDGSQEDPTDTHIYHILEQLPSPLFIFNPFGASLMYTAPKELKMNRDEGKELPPPPWIRTIVNAQKKPTYKPCPPRELWPRDTRPLPRVRRRATTMSPVPILPTPPKRPPPAIRRPTPTLRRSRRLALTTPPRVSDMPTIELTI